MKMQEFFSSDNKEHWIEEMSKCDWDPGKWLSELIRKNELKDIVGRGALVPMLTDGDKLVAFSTFAPLDEIQPTELTPWVGFVYTFPEYRGQHCAGKVLDWCESMATVMGKENIYISTDHIGLYEKYGYSFMQMMTTHSGEEARVYKKSLQEAGPDKDARMERGGVWKAEVVAAAKKDLDMI